MGPILPPTLHPLLHNVKQVVCRRSKTLALTNDGSVWSWGTCKDGSLGHGDSKTVVHAPKKIAALNGINIVQVAQIALSRVSVLTLRSQIDAGETSSAAVSAEGDVYTWGWGGSFMQGTAVVHLLGVSGIVCVYIVAGDGGLGHGRRDTQSTPALVEHISEQLKMRVASISVSSHTLAVSLCQQLATLVLQVGTAHMLAVTGDGTVLSWGNGEYGRCGNGSRNQPLPQPVESLLGKPCTKVGFKRF
jgi:alpha-tubulin suppressor-like RCC1 family protein